MMRDLNPELRIYNDDDIPDVYAHQIRSFVRIQWGDSYLNDVNPPLSRAEWQSKHVVLVEDQCLYSAAKVIKTSVEFQGESYQFYGLAGVFTYPAFQKHGFGSRLVNGATDYIILQSDADIALLWTGIHNVKFYENCGWEHTPDYCIQKGDSAQPESTTSEKLMLFISERARKNRYLLSENPLYIGQHSW